MHVLVTPGGRTRAYPNGRLRHTATAVLLFVDYPGLFQLSSAHPVLPLSSNPIGRLFTAGSQRRLYATWSTSIRLPFSNHRLRLLRFSSPSSAPVRSLVILLALLFHPLSGCTPQQRVFQAAYTRSICSVQQPQKICRGLLS